MKNKYGYYIKIDSNKKVEKIHILKIYMNQRKRT